MKTPDFLEPEERNKKTIGPDDWTDSVDLPPGWRGRGGYQDATLIRVAKEEQPVNNLSSC